MISMKNLKIKNHKTRKGCRYAKASLSAKISLLKAVFQEDEPTKKAAQALNIKYSTAKTLVRLFKKANQSIHWNFNQKQVPVKNVKITGVQRCHYLELDKFELKNESRQSQTDPSYGNCTSQVKFQIEQNHVRKGVSFQKIEIVSRIVEESLSFKPGFLLG